MPRDTPGHAGATSCTHTSARCRPLRNMLSEAVLGRKRLGRFGCPASSYRAIAGWGWRSRQCPPPRPTAPPAPASDPPLATANIPSVLTPRRAGHPCVRPCRPRPSPPRAPGSPRLLPVPRSASPLLPAHPVTRAGLPPGMPPASPPAPAPLSLPAPHSHPPLPPREPPAGLDPRPVQAPCPLVGGTQV